LGPIIAPFWTKAQFAGTSGKTYYRLDQTSVVQTQLNNQLRNILTATTWPTISVNKAVIVTWKNLQNEADNSQVREWVEFEECLVVNENSARGRD